MKAPERFKFFIFFFFLSFFHFFILALNPTPPIFFSLFSSSHLIEKCANMNKCLLWDLQIKFIPPPPTPTLLTNSGWHLPAPTLPGWIDWHYNWILLGRWINLFIFFFFFKFLHPLFESYYSPTLFKKSVNKIKL